MDLSMHGSTEALAGVTKMNTEMIRLVSESTEQQSQQIARLCEAIKMLAARIKTLESKNVTP